MRRVRRKDKTNKEKTEGRTSDHVRTGTRQTTRDLGLSSDENIGEAGLVRRGKSDTEVELLNADLTETPKMLKEQVKTSKMQSDT